MNKSTIKFLLSSVFALQHQKGIKKTTIVNKCEMISVKL